MTKSVESAIKALDSVAIALEWNGVSLVPKTVLLHTFLTKRTFLRSISLWGEGHGWIYFHTDEMLCSARREVVGNEINALISHYGAPVRLC